MIKLDEDWTGKKIFLKTDSGKIVTGEVMAHKNDFLKILDKYDMMVYILEKEISELEEKK